MLHSDSQASTGLHIHDIDLREIFECAHFKFMVSGQSKQTSKHTHARAQCSHASVELTQARPNYLVNVTPTIIACDAMNSTSI